MTGGISQAAAATCELAVALVFVRSAVSKLQELDRFGSQVAAYSLVKPALAGLVAYAVVCVVEAVIGVVLLIGAPGVAARGALITALAFLGVLLAAVSVTLRRGLEIKCGCFGNSQELVSRRSLLRLLLLLGAVILALASDLTEGSLPGVALTLVADPNRIAAVPLIVAGLALALLGALFLSLSDLRSAYERRPEPQQETPGEP